MNEEPNTTSTITEELTRLGRQLVEAGRLAWESEDRKRVQAELSENLRRFGDQVETTLQQARASEATKQVSEQAQKVAAKVQDAGVVDEVREGLVTGLSSLNRELSRLVDRLATRSTGGAPAGVEPFAATEQPNTPPADIPPAQPMGPGDPAI